jgi:hypothetical protein
LIDNERVEAKPELKGFCPVCSQPVIAKCGEHRIHHWAHRANKLCDSWWESETEWHRAWKSHFPPDWQEFLLRDGNGEKHIADVRTRQGLVLEFQHSHLDPQERNAREQFYKNMLWIVDGTRLKRDYPRFLKKINGFIQIIPGTFRVPFPEEVFPAAWLESSVSVIFDYQGSTMPCLFPGRAAKCAVITVITREYFVDRVCNHSKLFVDSEQEMVKVVHEEMTGLPF